MRRILTILMLVAVSAAAAQERFDHIFRRNPWNGGLNAAGIRQDSLSRSYAEIYFTQGERRACGPLRVGRQLECRGENRVGAST